MAKNTNPDKPLPGPVSTKSSGPVAVIPAKSAPSCAVNRCPHAQARTDVRDPSPGSQQCGQRQVGKAYGKDSAMADVQVTCINKQPRNDTHEGITHLGNPAGGWKWTRQEVINSINNKTNTFFTYVNGKRADVAVVNGPNGQYVRTHADGVWNDNLLALDECK